MNSKVKMRLDDLLVARELFGSRDLAARAVRAGEVVGADGVLDQPAQKVCLDVVVTVSQKGRYVSRGGDKLAGALADFDFDIVGKRCIDIGTSTGGFTDCVLQHGACAVVSVDVGYGQFAWQLREDARVKLFERTNIRSADLALLGAPFDVVLIDVSFTGLAGLIPTLETLTKFQSDLLALVKPQFEIFKRSVKVGGVVSSAADHVAALNKVLKALNGSKLAVQGLTFSKIKGPAGNIEFFLWASKGGRGANISVEKTVEAAHLALD
jgi:23S rRNA (cytidine1920-2'-O)/16S rRNA (cytidine1409-2'-O)-methyltransferase